MIISLPFSDINIGNEVFNNMPQNLENSNNNEQR